MGLSFKSDCLTSKTDGAIWFFISMNIPSNKTFTIDLIINSATLQIVSSSLLGYSTSWSLNWIEPVKTCDVICGFSNLIGLSASKLEDKIEILGIRLDDNTMSPYVALAVKTKFCFYEPHNISMYATVVIIQSEWDVTTDYSKILIPLNGTYFFSLIFHTNGFVCVYFDKTVEKKQCYVSIDIYHKRKEQIFEKIIYGFKTSFLEGNLIKNASLLSISFMYRFQQEDELLFIFESPGCENFFAYQLVLYEPLHKEKLAWTLSEYNFKAPGKICFPSASVNEGNAWDIVSCSIKISTNGLYFVALELMAASTVGKNVIVFLNNKQSIIEISTIARNEPMPENFVNTYNRASLLKFQINDTLHVETWIAVHETIFTGFLLYLS